MNVPHLVQYQGSKRLLAKQIIDYMPDRFDKLIEPFSGTASISIAAAFNHRSSLFHINDINIPLLNLLRTAIENPVYLINRYSAVWNEQFVWPDGHIEHFYQMREKFNNGDQEPELMLYLLARCVKGSIRYGKNGKFNQSPDKRRHGTNPQKMSDNILSISSLLKDKTSYSSLDYRNILDTVKYGDLIYMDPPYQGVCENRDNRYLMGINFDDFVESIYSLDKKNIDYLISYDGKCGEKSYGRELPRDLMCKKVLLKAGLSTQETLLGRKSTTYESLYISNSLYNKNKQNKNIQLSLI